MTVNPHEQAIHSTLSYRSVAELPTTPDLAVLATPPAAVPGLIAELGARGCRAAIVVTAGFGEGERAEGEQLRKKMLDSVAAASSAHRRAELPRLHLARPRHQCELRPPDAAGRRPRLRHPVRRASRPAVLDWASARSFGFSHVVSLGDMADVDFGDLLDYLALDQATRARSFSTSRTSPTPASSCRPAVSRRAPSRSS